MLVTFEDAPILRWKAWPSNKKFDWKTSQNTSRSQLIQDLDTNVHCLAVELSERISYQSLNHLRLFSPDVLF